MNETTIAATAPPARIPKPCMAKTAAIKAPRVFLLAYSDMMVAELKEGSSPHQFQTQKPKTEEAKGGHNSLGVQIRPKREARGE